VAGVLSLADACTLVAARGRLMQSVTARGAMAAWQATVEEAEEALRGRDRQLGIAAVNGPSSVVVSGDRDAVLETTAAWRARGRKATVLKVSHAFHSPHLDGILDELRAVAAGLAFAAPAIPIISNLTGRPATEEQLSSPDYWADHARRAVRFTAGVEHLCRAGVDTFVELGPDAALAGMARECFAALPGDEPRPVALAVQRRDRPEVDTFVSTMAQAYVRGAAVSWETAFAGHRARRVSLPTYAFRRERYWPDTGPGEPPVAGVFEEGSARPPSVSQASESQPSAPRPPTILDAGPAELRAVVRANTAIVLG
ncbi:acyltransferase domain-containing protein, partial [Streptomyces sp. 2MCAF27]